MPKTVQGKMMQSVKLKNILKAIWVSCCVFVLGVTLYRYESNYESDIGIFLVYGMLFFSFPASLPMAAIFALLAMLQDNLGIPLLDLIGSNYVGFCVMWLAFFGAGYWQWFVLVPRLWGKWKARRSGTAGL
jgi:divalent metal cation (Fe/Co/Zn/Cd) transporter